MISRFIFLILICHHRQMHRSLGFIICCVHAKYDISSSLLKSYVFYWFAFMFACLLVHVCYNLHAPFLFAHFFPELISIGCLNLIEVSPITICFSFVFLWFHILITVPSIIQLILISLLYDIMDNIDQVRQTFHLVIIWKQMKQLLFLL